MATTKKTTETKLTAAQAREEVIRLREENIKLKEGIKCKICGKMKSIRNFYVDTDPMCSLGYTTVCIECAKKIALRVDENGHEHECTKESVQTALRYLNKPYLDSVWNASVQEHENLAAGKTKSTIWAAYIKNVSMVNYVGMTWFDSDLYKQKIVYEDERRQQEEENHKNLDTYDDYIKNKEDVKRLLSYDPFESEALSDQPILYANLLGLLDQGGDQNDDLMRTSSCITIVRGFLQASKLDNTISQLMSDYINIEKNSATIRSLQDSKQKITKMITDLAAESCISLKNNKNAKKGENTWTGKIKRIKELDLRQGRVNGFDIETSKAMRQVMDNSNHSILQELKLDESDWSDMVAEQRQMITDLQDKLDKYTEISRILLSENLDLKDYIKDENINIQGYKYVNLEDLYSCFSAYGDDDSDIEEIEVDSEVNADESN